MFTNKYKRVPLDQIKVDREKRQRRDLKVLDGDATLESIRRRGVMSPIICHEDLTLIAGERRLEISRYLKLPDIPVRFASDLSEIELQIVELEENMGRLNLTWTDQCQGIVRIHNLYKMIDPEWNQNRTAEALGMGRANISLYLNVGDAILEGNEKIGKATTVRQAHNVLNRDAARRDADIINDITEAITPRGTASGKGAGDGETPPVICGDFLSWAETYGGEKFNFLHCDFPYGVNMQDSDQGNSELYGAYEDTPEVYWTLLDCLAKNEDNFISSSAHMMFWFSMEFYDETREFFRTRMPEWTFNKFPLIWTKTDNKGILPDAKRGPRRIYETCFFGSRDDRFIVRAVSNSYGAPTGIKAHQSEKPEPVLRHFMQMFVDEHSRVLDPTCGSGSSLRAAESLNANQVFGIEKNKEFAEGALRELKNFRAKQAAAKALVRT